jgi:hypothetical protein
MRLRVRVRWARAVEVHARDAVELGVGDEPQRRSDALLQRVTGSIPAARTIFVGMNVPG